MGSSTDLSQATTSAQRAAGLAEVIVIPGWQGGARTPNAVQVVQAAVIGELSERWKTAGTGRMMRVKTRQRTYVRDTKSKGKKRMERQLMLIHHDREVKHGSWLISKTRIWKRSKRKTSLTFKSSFSFSLLCMSLHKSKSCLYFKFPLILASVIKAFEHAKPEMFFKACTQLSVQSWCQNQRTNLASINLIVFYTFFVGTQW